MPCPSSAFGEIDQSGQQETDIAAIKADWMNQGLCDISLCVKGIVKKESVALHGMDMLNGQSQRRDHSKC